MEGVTSCSVNLLTNSLGVEGTASPQAVIEAVEAAGYGIAPAGEGPGAPDPAQADPLPDRDTPVLGRRLVWSLGFLAVLMYVSMGAYHVGLAPAEVFGDQSRRAGPGPDAAGRGGDGHQPEVFHKRLRKPVPGGPNMDTLVALGSSAAFIYSTAVLFALTGAQAQGEAAQAAEYLHEFYFESAAMILALITVGKLLEARSKGKTTNALAEPYEPGAPIGPACPGWDGDAGAGDPGAPGRCVCRTAGGEHPGRWSGAGGHQRR